MAHPWVRSAGTLGASQYFGAGLGLITTVVATRYLSPESVGAAAVAMSYPTLLWTGVGVKPASVMTRYAAEFRASGSERKLLAVCRLTFLLDLSIATLAALLAVGTSAWIARVFYGDAGLARWMTLYALSFPFCALTNSSQSLLLVWEEAWTIASLQLAQRVLAFALIALLLWRGAQIGALILGTGLAHAAVGLAAAAAIVARLRRDGLDPLGPPFSLAGLASLRGQMASLLGWNFLIVTSGGILAQAPILLLGHRCGLEHAGYYRIASALVVVCAYVESAMGRTAYPDLAAQLSGRGLGAVLPELLLRSRSIGVLAALPLLAAVPLLPALIPRALGASYGPMVPGAQLMLAGAAFGAVLFWLWPLYFAAGRLDRWALGSWLQLAAFLALGWTLQARWGFTGMAAAFALTRAVFIAAMAIGARRLAPLPPGPPR